VKIYTSFLLYVFSVKGKGKVKVNSKGKAIPVQPWTGPEGSRRMRVPDFKTIGI